jgi:hypothetical protein
MTQQVPTETPVQTQQIEDPNLLLGVLVRLVRDTLAPGQTPEPVMLWLKSQKPEVLRKAITSTQPPNGWAALSVPLLESLSEDQLCGVIAAMMAVYVQAL